MTITFNNALASLSAQLRQQPGASTFTVSREELNAVVGGVLNDARCRKEKQEKDEQNLKFMARISPHVLNFLAPILRGPKSLSLPLLRWSNYAGVSVIRAAAGGCIVAATNGKTMAIAYDAEATLTTPKGVREMRFTVPDCILDACRPPVAPKLIPPGGEPEELPEGICDLMVPDMVFASGAGIFVCPVGNPSDYSGCDDDCCAERSEGGVLATSHVSMQDLSDDRYCIMEARGDGNIVTNLLPIMTWVRENMEPVSGIGMGSDATGQMTDCMGRLLEWTHFDAFRVNEGKRKPEQVCIDYGNLGWTFGVGTTRTGDPLKSRLLTYTHGSGRYVLIQCEYMTRKMPDTPKADWFAPEDNAATPEVTA